MDVERPAGRYVERPLRQQKTVSRDHEERGADGGHSRLHLGIAQRHGLQQLEAARLSKLFDRALRRAQAASGRAVGLREHQRHVVARVEQRGERALCESRGAREDEAQESARRSCAAAWRASRARAAA